MKRGPNKRARTCSGVFMAAVLCTQLLWGTPVFAGQKGVRPEVLTLAETAAFLRVSENEIVRLASLRQLPARKIGGQWRFSRRALLGWLAGKPISSDAGEIERQTVATARPGYPPLLPPGYRQPVVGGRNREQIGQGALLTSSPQLAPMAMAQIKGRGTDVAQAAPASRAPPSQPIGEASNVETADDIFLRDQRVLLGADEVTLEFGQFYAHRDEPTLTLVAGGVGLGSLETDTFITQMAARYGLTPNVELFASVPFSHRTTKVFIGNLKTSETDVTEFGTISLGARGTVLREGTGVPEIVLTLQSGIPTGEASYSLGGGMALIKSYDPAILFAGLNYTHTFSRDFSDVTRLEPEDTVDGSLGFAFALNETLLLSTSLSGIISAATDFPAAKLRQSESFSLKFGLTTQLLPGLYIEPTASFGLDGPGNSFVLGVSVPYSFPVK